MKKKGAAMSNDPKNEDLQILISVDKVIHEPARLMIVIHLYVVESADFIFLMNQTGLTRGNLSSHIGKLENAGYVEVDKQFINKKPRTLLRLTKQGRKAFRKYKKCMKRVLDDVSD
jgi:DNA-binding MarR family transcriptional regulator